MARLCLALVFAALVAFSASAPGADSAESLTAEARELLDQTFGEGALVDAAAQKLYRALTLDPGYARAYVQVCRLEIIGGPGSGRLFAPLGADTAEMAIVKALDLDPRDGQAWVLKAHLYIDMHQLAEAKQALLRAGKVGADNAWLKLHFAEVYEEQGELELAADNYRAVIAAGTPSVRALAFAFQQLVSYYVVKRDWEQADEIYRAHVKLEPDNGRVRADYAAALVRHGRYSQAIEPARDALQIDGGGAARRTLGLALYGHWATLLAKGGDRKSALPYLEEARSVLPDLQRVAYEAYQKPISRVIAQTLVKQGLVDRTDLFRRPD
jgi:tetratricopeptide (TPR) repeat protein